MYKNRLGNLGHSWIEEGPLNALNKLPDCYVVEVFFDDRRPSLNISQITGHEKDIDCIKIYYKSKDVDKDPYRFSVDKKVTAYIIKAFWEDCHNRYRTPEMAPLHNFIPCRSDLESMRKHLKKEMFKVFRAEFESCADCAGGDFICHRNEYARLGCKKMLEFIRQADQNGIDIFITFDIENANADQIEKTLNDLEMIDATVTNETCDEEA